MAAQEEKKEDSAIKAEVEEFIARSTAEAATALTLRAPPDIDSLSWDEIVSLARMAEHGSKWYLGALASMVGRSAKYGEHKVDDLADAADIKPSTLKDYRWVWDAYDHEKVVRSNNSWSVYKIFAAQDDRFELVEREGWTAATAQLEIDNRRAAERAKIAKSEHKAVKPAASGSHGSNQARHDPSDKRTTPDQQFDAWAVHLRSSISNARQIPSGLERLHELLTKVKVVKSSGAIVHVGAEREVQLDELEESVRQLAAELLDAAGSES